MNREIKFRAWHKSLKQMLSAYVLSQHEDMNGYMQECRGWYGVNNQVIFSFDQVEWMQFTGLLDKNGKGIYEGDILDFEPHEWNRASWKEKSEWEYPKWVVQWDEENGKWDTGGGLTNECKTYKSVIGNIYENPELINQSQLQS